MASGSQPNLPSFVPQHPRRAVFRSWKRAIIFGLAFGIGAALTLVGVGVGIVKYRDRTTLVHAWPEIEIPQIGIRASLRTQAREGSAKYQFTAVPSSEKYTDAFNGASTTIDTNKAFTVVFYDGGGFERCRSDLDALTRVVDRDGKVASLDGNGTLSGCSTDDYVEAARWNLNYQFPDLKTWGWTVVGEADANEHSEKSTPSTISRVADAKGEDSITGVAFLDGDLDAKDHTFRVSQKGEKMTLAGWRAGQHVRYDCKMQSCLIENIDNNEVVHAKIIR